MDGCCSCGRLGFLSLGFLWQRPQRRLLEDMIAAPLNAILVKVSSMGLEPKHLGKSIQEMKATLFRLVCDFVMYAGTALSLLTSGVE